MAIVEERAIFPNQTWPQGDIRDPLGIWVLRRIQTGDGSGGSIKVTARSGAPLSAAYVYTCYSVLVAKLSSPTASFVDIATKMRLLSNWPDADPVAQVQGFSVARKGLISGASEFTAPVVVPTEPMVAPNERFIMLYDPRPTAGALDLVEVELNENENNATYAFEYYGYFWDRSVLQAPGGPRHPGAN